MTYFNDEYYMYDHHTRKTIKKSFKDTWKNGMHYSEIGLLRMLSEWNRVSVMCMEGRYIYYMLNNKGR